jgi:hypothetical protein
MKFEVFEELIATLKKCETNSFAAHQLGIDLIEYDTPFSHATWLAIRAHYGKAASEWIEWFMFERDSLSGKTNQAWDKDGNEICHTVESLWKVVEELRLADDFEEYTLPKFREFSEDEFIEKLNNLFTPDSTNEDSTN